MLKLRKYKHCDAKIITTWIKNEYAFRQWSADRYQNYPITAEDMNSYYDEYKKNNKICIMTAFDECNIIGHFTFRFINTKEVRLVFVIIDDEKRGQGYGKELVKLAIQYAFDTIKVNKISLGVFENNIAAINCYKCCGFKEIKLQNTECYECMGEIWNCIEMELK